MIYGPGMVLARTAKSAQTSGKVLHHDRNRVASSEWSGTLDTIVTITQGCHMSLLCSSNKQHEKARVNAGNLVSRDIRNGRAIYQVAINNLRKG